MAKKVVVVDDGQDILKVLTFILTKEGYDVITADDGTQGAQIIKEQKPDLILLDHQLPGKSGADICKEVKAIDALKDIPVFFISGGDAGEMQNMIEETGAQGAIPKPFDIEKLKITISEYLK